MRCVVSAAALMLASAVAHADVISSRAGGVLFLRGGTGSSGVQALQFGPRPTGLPAGEAAEDGRAVPFIGLPGTLPQRAGNIALFAATAPAIPRAAAMQAVMPLVAGAAADLNLDPALLLAVIHVESGFNPAALSPKGAVGLMQLMPATAGRYGSTDPRDPAFNVRAGAAHLQYLLDRYGDMPLALAAYNAGEGAVERHGMRVPPYAETQAYVPRVMALYRDYQLAQTRLRQTQPSPEPMARLAPIANR